MPSRTNRRSCCPVSAWYGGGIDPIQATFRGGKGEPLHRWYPYLEGYSPEFVQTVLSTYAPRAEHVHDPFAGTGTTPLTVARHGRFASYCELNPLLQHLIAAKVTAHSLSPKARQKTVARLGDIAGALPELVADAAPDAALRKSYTAAFGKSQFFVDAVFEDVLKLRSLIDELAYVEPAVGTFLTIAAVAALIPSSRLIRRGDVRFKNAKELERDRVELLEQLQENLRTIISDLQSIVPLRTLPVLMTSDARDLSTLPRQDFDAVVTSPPYLNGTNYFRNTKVELWFLRCLASRDDLAGFRYRAITAGINDVTVGKRSEAVSASVEAIVKKLAGQAYDQRIPKMVEAYFFDMAAVADGLKSQCRPNAPVLIDIGDSAYSGVHVDTPALLAEVFGDRGFELSQEVVLRRRLSRGGHELRQVLLAFKAPKASRRRSRSTNVSPVWHASWETFKANLPHQAPPYSKRNWGNPLHSICSYQGKMKPSLAHHLVQTFVPTGGVVLDPFAGVGTIPFEASLMGMTSYAFDISPAALAICAAKIEPAKQSQCTTIIKELDRYIAGHALDDRDVAAAAEFGFNGRVKDYFHEDTLREVLAARLFFASLSPDMPGRNLVLACLLHILHGNRPYALSRRSHPITPFSPTGDAEYRPLIDRLERKVQRCFTVDLPATFTNGHCYFQDATEDWPNEVDHLDAIITSPPFFDSTRFYLANWMRLWFCGWDAADFRSKPQGFIDERQKVDFAVYEPVFRQARERLKPEGAMVLHLGKSSKCNMAERLAETSRRWFSTADLFYECVEHCESHGIRDKGTVSEHGYLVLT
jgi:DNA modification methylase